MAAESHRHVRIIGLEILDAELYRRYREQMTPLLHTYGGAFAYDFTVAEVLKSETPAPIQRVFVMRFPNAAAAERFFADPAYRAIRAELFEPAVGSITKIAEYDE
jgi:uncharacterized protein (DUF1330 family)